MQTRKAFSHDAIRGRVRELEQRYSQSEIARRTGTPVANVHRYLKSGKIPAEFCGALVDGLNVNPAWLLHGEGAASLADVGERPARMAGELLELVEAMNAVAQMRLGSLAGKHHLKVLRELNDALGRFEALRARLSDTAGPVFASLIGRYEGALNKRHMQSADDLREACSQVARLIPDRDVERQLAGAVAYHEYLLGHGERAIEAQRDVFHHWLSHADLVDDRACKNAHNFALTLRADGRLQDADRVCRGMIGFVPEDGREWEGHAVLQVLLAALEIDLGRLAPAIERVQTAYRNTSAVWRRMASATLMRGLHLSGVLDWTAAVHFGEDSATYRLELLRFALWLEDRDALREAIDGLQGDFAVERITGRILLTGGEALAEGGKRALKTFRKQMQELRPQCSMPVNAILLDVMHALVCTHAGQKQAGVKAWQDAQQGLERLDHLRQPGIELLALHARNGVRLLPAKGRSAPARKRRECIDWLQQHIELGYGAFQTALD